MDPQVCPGHEPNAPLSTRARICRWNSTSQNAPVGCHVGNVSDREARRTGGSSPDWYSLGTSKPANRRRNHVRSTSAMCRIRPSSDIVEGGLNCPVPKLSGVQPLALELEGEAGGGGGALPIICLYLGALGLKPAVNDRSRRVGKYPRYLLYQRHRLPLLSQQ